MDSSNNKRFSDIELGSLVEDKNSDTLSIIETQEQKDLWIEENGNLFVIFNKNLNRYQVPDFMHGREEFIRSKLRDCAIWGNE